MTDNSYNNWARKSDSNIEKDIGLFIREIRQRQKKTQAEVAKEADISRSTLSLLEKGEAGNITTLIKVLRVLDQLNVLQGFEVITQISPLALAEMQAKKLQRIRKKKTPEAPNSAW